MICGDIATTETALYEPGSELKNDDRVQLCSEEYVHVAKGLVVERNKVFLELDEALGGKVSRGTAQRLILGWKDRINYPFWKNTSSCCDRT